jgi:hypothetical protein
MAAFGDNEDAQGRPRRLGGLEAGRLRIRKGIRIGKREEIPGERAEVTAPQNVILARVARFPGLRALAWAGDFLYASRGYELLRARIQNPSDGLAWQSVATFRPSLRRRASVLTRLTARLFRDGFHALAVLPSGGLVAAVPGAIITLGPNETEFRVTHAITRGTRPLHITAVPGGQIYWGEYFDNAARDEVHIYAATDDGVGSRENASRENRGREQWTVAYTFPKGAIRHVHNIVHDPWGNCLWILTGDYGDECRLLRASCDFSRVETVLQGNQQARAVALVAMEHGLYFSSDTPLEANHIYRLNRDGTGEALDATGERTGEAAHVRIPSRLAPISSSSIYGCRVGTTIFFSTMVEPSEVNRDRQVRVYGGNASLDGSATQWQPLLEWKKDRWALGLFQYGNAFLPDGNNTTRYLAVTTIAVESDDMATSLYEVHS